MILSFISIAFAIITPVIFLRNRRSGLLVFMVGVLLLPQIQLGSVYCRFEHLCIPLLLGALFLVSKRFSLPTAGRIYAMWLVFMIITCIYHGNLVITGIYGLMLPLCTLILFNSIKWKDDDIYRFHEIAIWVTIPIAIISVGQTLMNGSVLSLTQLAYMSPSRSAIEGGMASQSLVFRGVGVFETPAYAGFFFLIIVIISIVCFLFSDIRSRRVVGTVGAIAGCIGGIATLSATFIGGSAVLLLLFSIGIIKKFLKRGRTSAIITIAALVMFLGVSSYLLANNGIMQQQLAYNWNKVFTNKNRFENEEAQKLITENIIAGVGLPGSDFIIGDTIYHFTLITGGIIAGFIMLLLLSSLAICAYNSKQDGIILYCWLAAILVAGWTSTTLFVPRTSVLFWAAIGIALSLLKQKRMIHSVCITEDDPSPVLS